MLTHLAGGWQSTHSIPEDRGLLGSFNQVSDNNKVFHTLSRVGGTDIPAYPAQNHQLYPIRCQSGSHCRGRQLAQAEGCLYQLHGYCELIEAAVRAVSSLRRIHSMISASSR